ncbi:unnamed protein product [Adineta steineri]|uniref:AIG1-type G domain-containing protein n=1 Tax=Adineta steineri TaxID=433720 RepID=A0A819AQ76_9BILA|nr:unnamed protein product [Adineta steineri]CAF3788474.1 unnamed protein product [Adineta steineri]
MLLGEQLFVAKSAAKSITEHCQAGQRAFSERDLIVVDTPGLFDTVRDELWIQREITACIQAVMSGVHAFLLCIRCDTRYTQEEKDAIQWIKYMFGEQALAFCIVVFTHEDAIHQIDKSADECLADFLQEGSTNDLHALLTSCGNRYCAVSNTQDQQTQSSYTERIIEIIDGLDGKMYTNDLFELVKRAIRRSKESHGEFRLVEPNGQINVPPDAEKAAREYFRKSRGRSSRR